MNHIEISQKSIVFAFVVLLGAYLIHQLTDVLVLLFLSTIVASALNPLVNRLHRLHVPRPLAILAIYLCIIGSMVGMFSYLLPPLMRESANLLVKLHLPQLPSSWEFSQLQFTLQEYNSIISKAGTSIPSIMGAIVSTFSGFLVVFTFFMITYYILMERDHLHRYLVWSFGHTNAEKKARHFIDRIEYELGGWVRGELFLMLIIGFMTYLGLVLLGVPYALPLAILAGLLEAIPNIGPTISAIPAVIVALVTLSPTMCLAVVILYIIVQQLENNLIVPKVMEAAVNISPLVAIISLIVGLKLGGVAGAALAIPIFIFLRTIVREFYAGKNPLRTLDHEEIKAPKDL